MRDYRLSYAVKGEGDPLLLIHGFGAGMWVWEKQVDVLSQFYRVYALDLIGHGYSDRPKIDYRPETYLRSVSDFMEAVGIERATLIGNSMGGGIAWALAGRFPERVEKLVLIDCVPPDVLDHLKNLSFRMLSAIIDIPLLSRMVFWGVRRGSVRRILDDCVFDLNCTTTEVVDRQCRISRIEGTSWVLYSTFKHAREAPKLEKYLSRISHPTLLIWGAEDRVFSPAVGEVLRRNIPGSRLQIIKRSGHIPMWETPEEVNRVILDFLREA
jgi:pimeloyl-ACP methyl ester carboxylesterase